MQNNLQNLWGSAGGEIPDGWEIVSLEDLLISPKSITVGVMYPGSHCDSGVPLIKVSDVKNGNISKIPDFSISDSVDQEYKRTKLSGDELLITLVGNPGDCVVVTKNMVGWNAARALAVVRLKDPELREWLKLILLSPASKHIIDSRLNTTVQRTLNLKDIKELPVPLPPIQIRNRICNVVKNLETKIELNRLTNQTLEQMAQALFKSWFVDFDPVIDLAAGNPIPDELQARAELRKRIIAERTTNPKLKPLPDDIQKLFPSEFEESELGWIPKGWSLSKLGELIDFATGPAFKSKDFVDDGVKLARGDNVKEGFLHWGTKARYWPSITSKLEKYSLAVGDILIGMDGSKVGKNWVQVSDSDLPCLLIQRVARLRSKGMIGSSYLSVLISSDRFKNYVDLVKTGTSIPHISGGQIKSLVILNPNDNHRLFQRFEEVLAPFSLKNSKIKSEIITLISLRDTLLPKLISGEIQLDSKAQEPFNG
jgi:type I restriction enzyme S subunit